MTGGIEAAGDIATGALLGRAVEPRAGEAGGGAAHGVCLNCGTALIGAFCHACGQNGHVHKTLSSIGHDLLHGVFHFEGKVWRTIPMLVAHPGQLTRRYIDGERARFVSPLALFLFFVFLMFATFHSAGGNELNLDAVPATNAERLAKLDGEIAKKQVQLAKAQQRVAAGKADEDDKGDIEDYQTTIKEMQVARRGLTQNPNDIRKEMANNVNTGWPALDEGIAQGEQESRASALQAAILGVQIQLGADPDIGAVRRADLPVAAQVQTVRPRDLRDLFARVHDAAGDGDHAVDDDRRAGLDLWRVDRVRAAGAFFAQLRGTYALNWFSALWRTFALLLFGTITLTLFAMLLLGLGLMD